RYVDDALVYHHHDHTLRANLRKAHQLGQAEALYSLKRGEPVAGWSAVALAALGFLRIPLGFVRHLTAGRGFTIAAGLPLFHRLHHFVVAIGMLKAQMKYRSVFAAQPALGGMTKHPVIHELMDTWAVEHVDGRSVPVYGADRGGKLGRIQMDLN